MTGRTDREERRMTHAVPHAITFLDHGPTLAWLLDAPLWIGAVNLLCDAANGFSARHLCGQGMDRDEAEQSIREMAFEDEP